MKIIFLAIEHPDAQFFNSAEDLDTELCFELALAYNFNLADPVDQLRLLFSELMDSSSSHFLPGSEDDKLCKRLYTSAIEVAIEVYDL